MSAAKLDTVVFDLGGVVLEWAPQLPYEQVLPPAKVPAFMAAVDFWAWNRSLDAGQSFEAGEQRLIERFPDSAEAVRAYRRHFDLSLTGMVPGTGAIVAELQHAGVRLLALTNWSAETFPQARRRFGLLQRFEAIVVSGEERLAKPDPAIFELLLSRHQVDPTACVFIDDSPVNVAAAAKLGIAAVQFHDADSLRGGLVDLGLLGTRPLVTEPLFHVTEAEAWRSATGAGDFPWSTRGLSFERQGYVHCSFARQVAAVRRLVYADIPDSELVLLEIDPLGLAVVLEDVDAGDAYPHLYDPLPMAAVRSVRPL